MSRNNKRNRRFEYANQHASIAVYPNQDAYVGGASFTENREDDFSASIATDSSNATSFVVREGSTVVQFTGRQARTIQRLLNKHYDRCGRSVLIPGLDTI